ncbi:MULTISPECIES: protein phosphatase 2C domain-containing protein [unclassified Streptomyces]|uniref:protein phosphatase 2C domain-containing protein n=1 Tax=unclassified Streptomyces TaxID=2593676 RepID=UPI0036E14F58
MSQQGERPAAHEDDWWRRLYDETARDTGASHAGDSLDDRFDSASEAVSSGAPGEADGTGEGAGRGGADGTGEGAAPPLPPPAVLAGAWSGPPLPEPPEPHELSAPPAPPEPPAPAAPVRAESAGASPPPQSAPAVPETMRVRAPWEPPDAASRAPGASPAGPAQPRTFAVPRVPAVPPAAPDLPPEPDPVAEAERTPEPPVAEVPVPPVPSLPRRPVGESPVAPQAPATAPAWTLPPDPDPDPDDATTPAPARPQTPAPDEATAPASAPYRPVIGHVGDRPPTYDAEPTALPATAPDELDDLVADTVLDGAQYGTYTLRAASVRGDSARFRGEPRRDALLTARFGTGRSALVLVAVATGARATEHAHLAAADACRWIGRAVGRSHARLSEDIRAGRRGDLKSGLHRLTDRGYGTLRARAAELGLDPWEYTVDLRCLLLSADPDCRTRVFFGVGSGGLFRLRDGVWRDLEPEVPAAAGISGEAVVGFGSLPPGSGPLADDHLTMAPGVTAPPSPGAEGAPARPAEPFRFRASVARPGDTLLLCSTGLAEPLRGEPALARELAARWTHDRAPGLTAFLADTQLRVKGYADDRTSAAVWEA